MAPKKVLDGLFVASAMPCRMALTRAGQRSNLAASMGDPETSLQTTQDPAMSDAGFVVSPWFETIRSRSVNRKCA